MVSEITFFELHLDGTQIGGDGADESPAPTRATPATEPVSRSESRSRLPSRRGFALGAVALAVTGALIGVFTWRRRSRGESTDDTETGAVIEGTDLEAIGSE
ncbi:hypothetical protein HTSR_0685 [Halodesulfurarchaeum formicicum]|uniref:Uncharacterized protein n=1 Tax=Halodesulfurarchaeum formicicum TaxID=1873524 RepID=A0A1D8S3D8_9EURY|nr:hypothetical protein [Halodesulfurarchaeum formicicum]AOW79877.1 hypothetical protein HTSR_0685 [Halodesulfurarchaeum formicicum]APE95170.1 hypothetical protein HSR6_0711 [Halodesulfurarchaeum formicicum]